jgi:hypothetical protein
MSPKSATPPTQVLQLAKDIAFFHILDNNPDKIVYTASEIHNLFNHNTAVQLLQWVQRAINNIFNADEATIAMKYHLSNLIQQSITDLTALKKIYILAFLTEGHAAKDLGKDNPAIIMLNHMTHITDWAFGPVTLLWKKEWSTDIVLHKTLAWTSTISLYLKTKKQALHEARRIIQIVNPHSDEEFIQEILLTYLLNDTYTMHDIPSLVKEEEATTSQALKQLVSWTQSRISQCFRIFSIS